MKKKIKRKEKWKIEGEKLRWLVKKGVVYSIPNAVVIEEIEMKKEE